MSNPGEALTDDQNQLMQYMSDLSEEYYSAGWLHSLEYLLWDATHGNPKAFAGGALSTEEAQKLRELSKKCGGWVYWDDRHPTDSHFDYGETFIPLAEWETKFNDWRNRDRGHTGD